MSLIASLFTNQLMGLFCAVFNYRPHAATRLTVSSAPASRYAPQTFPGTKFGDNSTESPERVGIFLDLVVL